MGLYRRAPAKAYLTPCLELFDIVCTKGDYELASDICKTLPDAVADEKRARLYKELLPKLAFATGEDVIAKFKVHFESDEEKQTYFDAFEELKKEQYTYLSDLKFCMDYIPFFKD